MGTPKWTAYDEWTLLNGIVHFISVSDTARTLQNTLGYTNQCGILVPCPKRVLSYLGLCNIMTTQIHCIVC